MWVHMCVDAVFEACAFVSRSQWVEFLNNVEVCSIHHFGKLVVARTI